MENYNEAKRWWRINRGWFLGSLVYYCAIYLLLFLVAISTTFGNIYEESAQRFSDSFSAFCLVLIIPVFLHLLVCNYDFSSKRVREFFQTIPVSDQADRLYRLSSEMFLFLLPLAVLLLVLFIIYMVSGETEFMQMERSLGYSVIMTLHFYLFCKVLLLFFSNKMGAMLVSYLLFECKYMLVWIFDNRQMPINFLVKAAIDNSFFSYAVSGSDASKLFVFFQIGMIILLLAVYLILSIFRVTIPFPLAGKKERIILAKEKLFAGVVVVAFVLCVTGIVKVGMRYKETYQSVTDSVVYVLHYIGDDVEHLNEVEASDKELWEKQKKEYQKIWTKFSAYEKRMETGEKVVNADSEKATGTKGFSVVHELTPLHYITSFVPYKDTLFIENEAQYFQYPAFLFSLFFGTMVAWISLFFDGWHYRNKKERSFLFTVPVSRKERYFKEYKKGLLYGVVFFYGLELIAMVLLSFAGYSFLTLLWPAAQAFAATFLLYTFVFGMRKCFREPISGTVSSVLFLLFIVMYLFPFYHIPINYFPVLLPLAVIAWIIGYIRCQKEEVWGVHFITDPVIRILFAMLPVIFLAYEGITDAMQSVYSVIVFLLIEVAWCFILDLSFLSDRLIGKLEKLR